jgi:hypothetical protein
MRARRIETGTLASDDREEHDERVTARPLNEPLQKRCRARQRSRPRSRAEARLSRRYEATRRPSDGVQAPSINGTRSDAARASSLPVQRASSRWPRYEVPQPIVLAGTGLHPCAGIQQAPQGFGPLKKRTGAGSVLGVRAGTGAARSAISTARATARAHRPLPMK